MADTNNGLKLLMEAKRSVLNTYSLGLYKTNVSVGPTSVIGDLVEPTYHGYARQAMTGFGVAYINGGGAAESDDAQHTFVPTDAVVTETIYGWFIATAGNVLVTGGLLDTPVVLSSTHTALLLTPFDTEAQA